MGLARGPIQNISDEIGSIRATLPYKISLTYRRIVTTCEGIREQEMILPRGSVKQGAIGGTLGEFIVAALLKRAKYLGVAVSNRYFSLGTDSTLFIFPSTVHFVPNLWDSIK